MEEEIKDNKYFLEKEYTRFYLGINSHGIRECFLKSDYKVNEIGLIVKRKI